VLKKKSGTRERMRINAFKVPKGDHEAQLVFDERYVDDMLRMLEHQRKLQLPPMPPRYSHRRNRGCEEHVLPIPHPPHAQCVRRALRLDNVRFAALPMGSTFAPACAQHLYTHLLAVTRARYARETPQHGLTLHLRGR
jgi:hypothetical protein